MNRIPIIVASAALAVNLAACDELSPDTDKRVPAAPAPAAAMPAPKVVAAVAPPTAHDQDLALSTRVRRELQSPDGIGGLEVDAANGVVTLYGTVDAQAEKQRAALVAMGVEGVRSVVNNLVVLRGS